MAAIDHAAYSDEMPVEIATPLPHNSGQKALKDVTFGSVCALPFDRGLC
jgi:hypothetical protein